MKPSHRIENVRYLTLVSDDEHEADENITGSQALFLALAMSVGLLAVILIATQMGVN